MDVVLHFSFEFAKTGSSLNSGNELQFQKRDPFDFNPAIGEPVKFLNIEEPPIVVAIIVNSVEKHVFCEASTDSISYLDNLKHSMETDGWKKRLDGTKVRKQSNR